MAHPENHPRPQLVRPRWIDLCGEWQFAYDDDDVGLLEGWADRVEVFDRTIIVPFPPESSASGIGIVAPHSVLWYRRTFTVDESDLDGRLLLHFGAVDYQAEVWVNGHSVVCHEGGHTPFTADITSILRTGEQVLVVRAEDRSDDKGQPRGKQYWDTPPEAIWYNRTSGIWQTVWLEPVPAIYVSEVRWTPDLDRERLAVQVSVVRPPTSGPLRLRLELHLHGETLADDTVMVEGTELIREIAIAAGVPSTTRNKRLWSPEHPNLIDATLTLLDGDVVVDQVMSYVGFRSIKVGHGRFILNGLPYFLRLVLSQGYWPQSHLASPDSDALQREVLAIKIMGFNGVRVHQKIEDPRFLYWCDRLGLLVWSEMPSAYSFSPSAVERLTREWLEVLRRDYSHPCVVTWVPFNESWGVPSLPGSAKQQAYVRAIFHLTHAIDSTRPVLANDGWEHLESDILGIHDYTSHGQTIGERYGNPQALERTLREVQPGSHSLTVDALGTDEPVVLSEFGGITLPPSTKRGSWYGYGFVGDEEALLAKYAELVGAVLTSTALAGFCYTQLTDVEQEPNGLFTADRKPKLDPKRVMAITSQPAAAVPGEAIHPPPES